MTENEQAIFDYSDALNEIYLISRHVRDAAWLSTYQMENWCEEIEIYARDLGVKWYFAKKNGVFLYRFPHQKEVFCMLEDKKVEKGLLRNYVLGRLLGYGEESMDEYINHLKNGDTYGA